MTFRQERQIAAAIFLGFMAIAGIVAALIGGCAATPVERRTATEPTLGSQGGSWELVFSTPIVAQSRAYTDARAYPEFRRNDENLNYNPPTAQLASSQWPEAPRPDLAYSRQIYLDPRAHTLQFYEPSTGYLPGPYWSGSPNVYYRSVP